MCILHYRASGGVLTTQSRSYSNNNNDSDSSSDDSSSDEGDSSDSSSDDSQPRKRVTNAMGLGNGGNILNELNLSLRLVQTQQAMQQVLATTAVEAATAAGVPLHTEAGQQTVNQVHALLGQMPLPGLMEQAMLASSNGVPLNLSAASAMLANAMSASSAGMPSMAGQMAAPMAAAAMAPPMAATVVAPLSDQASS